jgi:hypothetical protein
MFSLMLLCSCSVNTRINFQCLGSNVGDVIYLHCADDEEWQQQKQKRML